MKNAVGLGVTEARLEERLASRESTTVIRVGDTEPYISTKEIELAMHDKEEEENGSRRQEGQHGIR